MTEPASAALAPDVKACCAQLYASDAVRALIGDSLHPGGTGLSSHLAETLGASAELTVLDVACGRGTSAVHLARTIGCRVVGVDYSAANVAAADQAAETGNVGPLCTFIEGDAESLPIGDGSVDIVICECALCTFPDKPKAAREFARVLRRGGRVGITDVTSTGHLPGLDGLLAWIACIADAKPVDEYATLLREANFHVTAMEDHRDALIRLIDTVRARLVIGKAVLTRVSLDDMGWDQNQAHALAVSVTEAVRHGDLGYALLTAHRL